MLSVNDVTIYSDPTAETSLVVGATSLSLATPPAGGATRPVNSVLEIAGTDGAFLYPRLTDEELLDLDNDVYTVTGGLQAYNTDGNTMNFYVNGRGFVAESDEKVLVATKTFNAVEFADIFANPYNLIAAPGATSFIQVLNFNITIKVDGASVYTDGGDVRLQYGDDAEGLGIQAASAEVPQVFIQAPNPTYSSGIFYGNVHDPIFDDIRNLGVYFSSGGAGQFNNGDDVAINITVYYKIGTL